MSLTPFAVRVASADDLVLQLNVALAPLTSALISNLEIGQMRNEPASAANLFAAFGSDTTGATPLGQPFQVISFSASLESQVTILLQQFITAHPAYFFAGPYMIYRPANPDPNAGVIGILVFNTLGAAAAANWAGSGGGGSGGGPKPPVALVDAPVVAINATASDNFTLLTTAAVGATRQLGLPSALSPGMRFYLEITQPAAGGPCALTYNAIYKFIGGLPPVLQTAPNAVDLIGFYYDGTSIYGSTTLDALNSITMTPGAIVPPTPVAGEFVLYPVNDNGYLRPIIKLPDATIMDLDQDTVYVVCNTSASVIPAGTAVYVSGVDAVSGKLVVSPAKADALATATCLGVLVDALAAGNVTTQFGRVMTFGRLANQNTTITGNFWNSVGVQVAAVAGQAFFLSDVVAGGLTQTAPTAAGSFRSRLGAVRTVNVATGILEMRAGSAVPTNATYAVSPTSATFAPAVLTDAATVAVNAALSDNFTLLLTAAVGATRIIGTPTNLVAGMKWALLVTQPAAAGPCALTFNAPYLPVNGLAPVLQIAASATDLLEFYYDGTTIWVGESLNALNSVTKVAQSVSPGTPAAGKAIEYINNDTNGVGPNQSTYLRPIVRLADGTFMDLDADTVFVICNTGGTQLAAGQAVYVSGVDPTSGKLAMSLAKADANATAPCLGVLVDTLPIGNGVNGPTFGRVMVIGTLRNQNTTITGNFWNAAGVQVAAVAGQPIYLSDAVAGGLTQTAPTAAGSFSVRLGAVRTVNVATGTLELRATIPMPNQPGTISCLINGNGTVPSAGTIAVVEVPFDCTIKAAKITSDVLGNAAVDIRRLFASIALGTPYYPNTAPAAITVAQSIVAAAAPTLTGAQAATDSTLTGWTVTLNKGDWLQFNLTSAGTLFWVNVTLDIVRR